MNTSRYLSVKIRTNNRNIRNNFARAICTDRVLQKSYEIKPLAEGYNPEVVEANKYSQWEKDGRFTAKDDIDGDKYSLVLPPPNITGSLHLGHALTTTLQDVLSRWKRMKGFNVTWLPGTDHAGIATQAIVEKHLLIKGTTRESLGRENFEKEVWKWKEINGGKIKKQLRKLGASLDWSKEVFTMDEQQCNAVNYAFIKLFNDGLIYRGDNLVNWSCELRSTISDIEVDILNISGPTNIKVPGYSNPIKFGLLTEFAYKLKDSNEEITVATTRPETILGDVAIGINPKDEKYIQFIGRFVEHPFTKRSLPIIADSSVDKDFGTGALKITPAHDKNDYEIAKRHNLKMVSVINESGCMFGDFPSFNGLKRYKARDLMLKELDRKQLLRDIKPHVMTLPICSRSGDVIELLPRSQWYINCKEMAAKAVESGKNGDLKIVPEAFLNNWNKWLEEERDWCISRQLWWGHRIPAYKCYQSNEPDKFIWIAAASMKDALKKATALMKPENTVEIICEQDADVLDTWFSSGIYPFSAWGWPKQTENLKKLYPLNLMVTGHDILCFWVVRMVMLGTKLTEKLPFDKVLLHGIICDASGAKMSKSKGNVIDPEDIINGISLKDLNYKTIESFENGTLSEEELKKALDSQSKLFPNGIPICGTDALRFSLCSKNVKNHYIHFDVDECYADKLFCNKIWQSLKYFRNAFNVCMKNALLNDCKTNDLALIDRWILSRLSCLVQTVNQSLDEYNFHIATAAIKNFLYRDVCDFYIECTKEALKGDLTQNGNAKKLIAHCNALSACFNTSLRCLAPFMPYLTEELILSIPLKQNCIHEYQDDIANLLFPEYKDFETWRNFDLEKKMESTINIISTIRQMLSTYKIGNKIKPNILIECKNHYIKDVVVQNKALILLLTKANEIIIKDSEANITDLWSFSDKNNCKIFVDLPHLKTSEFLKVGTEKLLKTKDKLLKNLDRLEAVMLTDGYKFKASQEIQLLHTNKIKALKENLAKLEQLERQG